MANNRPQTLIRPDVRDQLCVDASCPSAHASSEFSKSIEQQCLLAGLTHLLDGAAREDSINFSQDIVNAED